MARVRVRVRVIARVAGGDLFPHTHACKAGSSGMRFTEGERDLVESERVVKRSNTHATKHKTQASQFGIHYPHRMWVPLSQPVICVWPLDSI